MSSRWNFTMSSTVPPLTIRPRATSFSRMSPASALLASALSLAVMSAGILAGPHRPYQL
jgi:hypothetical protein